MINQNESNNSDTLNSPLKTPQFMRLPSRSIIQIIWRSRWILLLTMIMTLVLTFIYISNIPDLYTSTSRIYVEQSGPKIITETQEGVMTQSTNYLYTQAALLQSTPILTAALDTPIIRQMKTFEGVENPISLIKRNLVTEVGIKDEIINISFSSPYPVETAQIVNTIVESYINFHENRKRNTSGEILKILNTEKEKSNKKLTEKLKAMMDYKTENPELVFEGTQGNIVIERLQSLSTVLTEAQLNTIERKSVYDSIKETINDPNKLKVFIESQQASGVVSSRYEEKEELKSQLYELEKRLMDRLSFVKPNHPAVTAIENEISQIKKQIDEMVLDTELAEEQLAIAEKQYLEAKNRENQIAKYYQDQRELALALNEDLAEYTILQSEWEQTKKLCDILDERIRELDFTEDVGILNISILEKAHPATAPSKLEKARIMSIAVVIGLLLGAAIALLRDWMDQRIRSIEEITGILGMPVLGVVPSMSKRLNIINRGQITHLEPDSYATEAYRSIRTAVFFGTPNDRTKTILITSPEEMEGRTILASNIAIVMAQAGQHTLLLDADFRNPMQHLIFKVEGENGLVSLLSGTSKLENSIHTTEIDGLDLLPCRTQLVNPLEILSSSGFAKLLSILSDKYDRVIIDSPPIVPVTDAKILAAICDITLLVLRAKKSTRKMCLRARDELLSVKACVLGAVVNDVPKKGHRRYYGNYEYGRYEKMKI